MAADPRFSSNALRVEHHDELEAIIVRAFAGKTAEQVVDRLDAAQIANARMNTVDEFLDHPQLAARGKWRMVDSPAGPLRALVPPFGFDDVEPRMGPIPGLGEHTDRILTELGFDGDTIAAWRRRDRVSGPVVQWIGAAVRVLPAVRRARRSGGSDLPVHERSPIAAGSDAREERPQRPQRTSAGPERTGRRPSMLP